jgi:hypothetical protein
MHYVVEKIVDKGEKRTIIPAKRRILECGKIFYDSRKGSGK